MGVREKRGQSQISLTDANSNVTNYAYDGFDRLATTTWPDGSNELLTYDPAGNVLTRRTRRGDVIAFAYDTLNRMIQEEPPAPTPTTDWYYDLDGRVIGAGTGGPAIPAPAPTGGVSQFSESMSYDAEKRGQSQISLTDANSNVTDYGYDGFDRLATTFYPDNSNELLAYDADGNVLTRRTRPRASTITAPGCIRPRWGGSYSPTRRDTRAATICMRMWATIRSISTIPTDYAHSVASGSRSSTP